MYTFGATGILNALNAADGTMVWSRNAATDADAEVPDWGFASSPLVVDDVVIIAVAGALAAYDLASGEPRWSGPDGGYGYSSPHLVTIDGMRRIAVAHGTGGWTVKERWTSDRLKPYFSDFVVHNGHAFGFDGSILACIDVEDGKRKWKGGRYGSGQLVLLADQDVLLVLSEQGELALVEAVADRFTELARFPAIEGKTWNHPVLAGDILLVRNSEEMAAFRMSLAGS